MLGFFDLPWQARRSLAVLGLISYLFGVTVMHHHVVFSIWLRGELAHLVAGGPTAAPWVAYWVEGQANDTHAMNATENREAAQQGSNGTTMASSARNMQDPRGLIGSSAPILSSNTSSLMDKSNLMTAARDSAMNEEGGFSREDDAALLGGRVSNQTVVS